LRTRGRGARATQMQRKLGNIGKALQRPNFGLKFYKSAQIKVTPTKMDVFRYLQSSDPDTLTGKSAAFFYSPPQGTGW